jgi:hypothetical protein
MHPSFDVHPRQEANELGLTVSMCAHGVDQRRGNIGQFDNSWFFDVRVLGSRKHEGARPHPLCWVWRASHSYSSGLRSRDSRRCFSL